MTSVALFERARRLMPGGVSSPVRAFHAVGGTPRFIVRGDGAWFEDADGRRLLDLVLGYGPLLLGHRYPAVREAVLDALDRGASFGAPTELELELAERVIATFPSIEMVRFVTSGTEATMSAVRLARAATGRAAIVKFAGCYHGHADGLLAAATVADTIVLPFNDLDPVRDAFRLAGDRIAALIVEPVAGNMGVVPPLPGFLAGLRELTERHGALLIFDEVMTGWRVHPRGAQGLYGVTPDLTCLGKVVGGGFPAAAYGGRRALMSRVAPDGPVYQAGTLAGHPVAMAAGIATLDAIAATDAWTRADRWAAAAAEIVSAEGRRQSVAVTVQRSGAMLTPFFTDRPVRDFAGARAAEARAYARFFHALLAHGVHLPPSPLEAAFTSSAHGDVELEHFARAVSAGFAAVAGARTGDRRTDEVGVA